MIDLIKRKLLENPQHIVDILNYYDFYSVRLKSKEITCGLEEGWNPTAIHIRLIDNDFLFVNDYARGTHNKDILNYIITQKNQTFKDVINKFKLQLGITDSYYEEPKKNVFGGFYNKIKKTRQNDYDVQTYSDDIFNKYPSVISYRFLKDHISAEIQKEYIRFDAENQRFIFPIYNYCGEIIGIKGRANNDDDIKYLYTIPCSNSQTLYGYWQNYTYMQNGDVVVCESEKAFLQGLSYSYRNIVSTGCSTISPRQAQLIMMLNPKRVCIANDTNIGMDIINKNIETLKVYSKFRETEITYWDCTNTKYIELKNEKGELIKDCITDRGKQVFYKILEEEIFNEKRMEVSKS